MNEFWAEVAPGDVAYVAGVDARLLGALPADAPAVVFWRPAGWVDAHAILAELEQHALALYPTWLPEVEDGDQVLTDLAERARTAEESHASFPDPTRATALARAIGTGSGRQSMALAVELPGDLSPTGEGAAIAALERIAGHGRFAVWLVGRPPHVAKVRNIRREMKVRPRPPADASTPRAGRPQTGSAVEQRLETLLRSKPWAAGRAWNQSYRGNLLAAPIWPDLMWEDERVVVEIDGPEHCLDPDRYAADRRRDVDLQLAGYVVLRFTNAEVEHDVGMVAARIERMLTMRRRNEVR